jgi:hypothetical protein
LKNLLILEIAKVSLEECDSYMIVVRLRCFFQPLNTDIVLYLTCSNTLSATNPTWTEVVISKKIYSMNTNFILLASFCHYILIVFCFYVLTVGLEVSVEKIKMLSSWVIMNCS